MKFINIVTHRFLMLSFLVVFMTLLACEKEENPEDQIDPDKIELLSVGPSPALLGGEITFIGRNLDMVTEVILPSNVSV